MQGMFKTSISALEREHSDNKRIMFLTKRTKLDDDKNCNMQMATKKQNLNIHVVFISK